MGLDWIVLAKEQNGLEINPTEVIGSRRANREDPEVMEELRRIWEDGNQLTKFEQFVDELVSREIPPIVIPFASEFEAAIPAVRSEAQFYGFRGKTIEPYCNRISEYAERNGYDMSWLYGTFNTQVDIEAAISLLQQILSEYRTTNTQITSLAEKYYRAWRRHDSAEAQRMEEAFETDPEIEDHVLELYSYFGAIDWLQFWSDKGFKIVAEY
jgi:hypothetical protein